MNDHDRDHPQLGWDAFRRRSIPAPTSRSGLVAASGYVSRRRHGSEV